MDAATAEFLKQAGLFGLLLVIVLSVLSKLLDNLSAVIKANSEAQKNNAANVQSMMNYLSAVTRQLSLIQRAFENHTQVDTAASKEEAVAQKAFVDALTGNTKTLTEMQTTTLDQLSRAMGEMRGAQSRIVQDINQHIDEATTSTSGAINAAHELTTRQHTDQSEEITTKMNELQNAIVQNGKDRKAQYNDIQAQLTTMTETLAALQRDMQALNAQAKQSQAQQAAIIAIGQKVDLLSTAFDHLKKELTPPPAPPETPPPVDPPKSEETP